LNDDVDLSVEICGIRLKNPFILASGPRAKDAKDLNRAAECGAGAVVTKTIGPEAAIVPRPCITRTLGGVINNELWSDLTYEAWLEKELKEAKKCGVPVIGSIGGARYINGKVSYDSKPEDIEMVAKGVVEAGDVDMLELPAYDPRTIIPLIKAAKKGGGGIPVIAKLAMITFEPIEMGMAAKKAGADAISFMDSMGNVYKFDVNTGKTFMGSHSSYGRISGASLKPFMVYGVAQLAKETGLPVIGIGGIMSGEDAVEAMMAGAQAVQVCTSIILNGHEFFGTLKNQLESYMRKKSFSKISDFQGMALRNVIEREEKGHEIYEPHNPKIDKDKCISCGLCIMACPWNALYFVEKKSTVNTDLCYGCSLCSSLCPTKAITIAY
jgi:dihydroorotate dehydrogenase (NAD+) catalytic subunit